MSDVEVGHCKVCSKKTEQRCGWCRATYYCGKKHQVADWKAHKPQCSKNKFEEQSNGHLGRHLVALENIKPDQILFKESPLILGPKIGICLETDLQLNQIFCLGCYKEIFENSDKNEQKCAKCSLPICSSQCEELYYHKSYECRFFQEANQVKKQQNLVSKDLTSTKRSEKASKNTKNKKNSKLTAINESEDDNKLCSTENKNDLLYNKVTVIQSLLYFRAILMKHYNFENYSKFFTLDSGADFRNDLASLEKTTRIFEDFKKLFSTTNHPTIQNIHKPDLHAIIGIFGVNGVDIQISANFTLLGIYSQYSILEHSCAPNTKIYFSPSKISGKFDLFCRSSVKICKNEHLTTSYTNILWNTEKRREDLKKRRFFWCECIRCLDPTELGSHFSTILCTNCKGYAVPKALLGPNLEAESNQKIIKNSTENLKNSTENLSKSPTSQSPKVTKKKHKNKNISEKPEQKTKCESDTSARSEVELLKRVPKSNKLNIEQKQKNIGLLECENIDKSQKSCEIDDKNMHNIENGDKLNSRSNLKSNENDFRNVNLSTATHYWECENCGKTYDNRQVSNVDKKLGELVSKLKPELPIYFEMTKSMEEIVHPNYYLNFIVLHSLIQLFGEEGTSKEILDEKIKICHKLLGIIKILDPGLGSLHIYAGVIYYEMHSAILKIAGGETDDDFEILRRNPDAVKMGKFYLEKCIESYRYENFNLPETKLKLLANKKMEYLNIILKHKK